LGEKEMAMTEAGKNRIMIFDPRADGTYVIEFRTAAGEALAILNPQDRDDSGPALPGTYALWAVCAGRSVRNLWRAHGVFAKRSPPIVAPNSYTRVPETLPELSSLWTPPSGRVLV
jgi:hypothetical protein